MTPAALWRSPGDGLRAIAPVVGVGRADQHVVDHGSSREQFIHRMTSRCVLVPRRYRAGFDDDQDKTLFLQESKSSRAANRRYSNSLRSLAGTLSLANHLRDQDAVPSKNTAALPAASLDHSHFVCAWLQFRMRHKKMPDHRLKASECGVMCEELTVGTITQASALRCIATALPTMPETVRQPILRSRVHSPGSDSRSCASPPPTERIKTHLPLSDGSFQPRYENGAPALVVRSCCESDTLSVGA